MDIKAARKQVIDAGKKLVEKDLIARTWGNVSCRVDESRFVITPSGKSYESLKPEDIVEVSIDKLGFEGDLKPSSEKGVHASVYKLKPEINFVVHTHQMNASAVSAAGIKSFSTGGRFNLLGDKVLLAGYGLPGTGNLRSNVEKAVSVSTGNSIIMKKHGALNFGKNAEEAFNAAEQLEKACGDYIKDTYSSVSGNWMFNPLQMGAHVIGKPIEYMGKLDAYRDYLVNDSPYVVACSYLDKSLYPYLDDFAQIVGPKMMSVENNKYAIEAALKKADAVFIKGFGAICKGADKEAVSMIVEKNCMAYLTAKMVSSASRPINVFESNLMRYVYTRKYSRQMA